VVILLPFLYPTSSSFLLELEARGLVAARRGARARWWLNSGDPPPLPFSFLNSSAYSGSAGQRLPSSPSLLLPCLLFCRSWRHEGRQLQTWRREARGLAAAHRGGA
jgi:hypothetical protein